jgi:hypothetical protein
MDIKDIHDELLRLEYPYLHTGSDPDIERYCYLRSSGQGRAALAVYQFRIKPRYPDDTLRMALLRCYRNRDPLFSRLLAVGYRRLVERALERIRRIIDYISEKMRGYNKEDVYSTIKTIEDILRFFPREQYEAIAGVDRMYRYAQVLDHHAAPMGQAAELIRGYLTQSLPILDNERRRRNEARRQQENAGAGKLIDFSTVVFSSADLERMEIPSSLSRVEDKTLAYCAKYWNLIHDAAFDQILLLYSHKHGKKNHAIYLTIRRGRDANYRDEDILSSVMSMLVTGYYYSIQGDRYLQQNWRAIKDAMEQAASKAAPRAAKAAAPARSAAPVKAAPPRAGPKTAPPAPPAPDPASKAAPRAAKAAAPAKSAAPVKAAPPRAGPKTAPPAPAAPEPGPATAPKPSPASQPLPVSPPSPVAQPAPKPVPLQTAGGSVSDRLRKLSGRGYDLYQDRFLAHARPAIRKILSAGRGIFFSLPEQAEDLVFHYLRDHYADPYMNWAESAERRQLAGKGFDLPSLDPVIDECFKRISKK